MIRRVLMVSPHFPPDTSAATHRVRLLAPHLARWGWEPTVVSIDPRDYEGRLDAGLAALLPRDLRVVRSRAWPSRWTRCLGVGDLGLRALRGLHATCAALLARERFDALFITIYPTYPALLGPVFKRRFGVPFVLDYQDPWVGAWGASVGGGPDGRVDVKSRLARALATTLEPRAVRAADAVTAVSSAMFDEIRRRYPDVGRTPFAAIPVGGDPADFERVRERSACNPYFDPEDGRVHLCSVGTVLPLGFETLRAVLRAVALLRDRRPLLCERLRLYFVGTSNQTSAGATARVRPVARQLGVEAVVTEVAPRIDYLAALTVQAQATALLMLGSSEPHYTASKLYPGLLAERPVLAAFHSGSSAVDILRRVARPPAVRLVTYDDTHRAESRVEQLYLELSKLCEASGYEPAAVDRRELRAFSAQTLAGQLAAVLDGVMVRR